MDPLREALERIAYVTRPGTYTDPWLARAEAHRIAQAALIPSAAHPTPKEES
jgi:hypothetical protein